MVSSNLTLQMEMFPKYTVYFTFPFNAEPVDNMWEEEAAWKKISKGDKTSVTFEANELEFFSSSGASSRLPVGAVYDTRRV